MYSTWCLTQVVNRRFCDLLLMPTATRHPWAPLARSDNGLKPAIELASDSTGQYIIESHFEPCCDGFDVGVEVLPKQFANNAYPESVASVYAVSNSGVADDPTTKTYLVSTGDGIYRLAENTNGQGQIYDNPPAFSPPIVSIINDTCAGQMATLTGPSPYTYVLHSKERCAEDAVYVYTENASCNATPLRILSGPNTGMNQPYGIAEGP